ncbi:MAG TPA: hypothetical protein DCY13_03635, partial [Verrucomicrobiales bacterium]|nr:hypothetical protein [Verrucomicrobiales bacterium]
REIRVRDLGRVVRGQKDREILTRTDGSESVQIDIYKEADANMVAVARAVTERIGNLQKVEDVQPKPAMQFGPPRPQASGLAQQLWREEGAVLQIVADRSKFIESS